MNSRGTHLADWTQQNELSLMSNPAVKTFRRCQTESLLDLAFGNPNVAVSHINITLTGSDHALIYMQFESFLQQERPYSTIDWHKWQSLTDSEAPPNPLTTFQSPHHNETYILQCIFAQQYTVTKSASCNSKKWCNQDISEALRETKRCTAEKYKAGSVTEVLLTYQKNYELVDIGRG